MLVLAVLLLLPGSVSAWSQESYQVAVRRLCADFGCECEAEAVVGSNIPDVRFRDAPTHHCYKPLLDFPQKSPGLWEKPVLNECPALDKTAIWLAEAENETGCKRWYDFGIALHYFLDSKEFWNTVIFVNQTCAGEQESEVGDYLQYGGREWKSCSCGICVTSEDFIDWLAEFRERVKAIEPAKSAGNPSVTFVSNGLDLDAVTAAGDLLRRSNITVSTASVEEFGRIKNDRFIVLVGGHMAPGVGPIVGSLLTEEDKAAVLKAVFTGVLFKKTDVWAKGQSVYVVAGYGVNETQDGLMKGSDVIAEKALELNRTKGTAQAQPECVKNDDCGTPYYGPYICSTRKEAARVLYTPSCVRGVCSVKAGRPSSIGCFGNYICLSFLGCVDKTRLPEFESLRRPMFTSWISTDRATRIAGQGADFVLYARTILNDTMRCEYYDDEWENMGTITTNNTLEIMRNVSSDRYGKVVYTQRIRCGNASYSSEFTPIYYAEHNFTLNNIPPPMMFTFSLRPETVNLRGCFDRRNVTLRIENLCSHNITCQWSFGMLYGSAMVRKPGENYTVYNYRWGWSLENTTYNYLSYYTGADYGNSTTYQQEQIDDDGNTVIVNKTLPQSLIDYYARFPKNLTIFKPTTFLNETSRYEWDFPHWWEGTFLVDSGECTIGGIPVAVSCTDQYDQHIGPLKKTLKLNVTRT